MFIKRTQTDRWKKPYAFLNIPSKEPILLFLTCLIIFRSLNNGILHNGTPSTPYVFNTNIKTKTDYFKTYIPLFL